MTAVRTWKLSNEAIAEATAKIEKINARAEKKGLVGRYSYRLGESELFPVYDDRDAVGTMNGAPYALVGGRPVPCPIIGTRSVTEFVVEGDAPSFGGWTFLATITNDDGAVVIRSIPGFDGEIDRPSIRPGECDHCRKVRNRRDTYLVENVESGKRVQVGSACAKDFLGIGFSAAYYDLDGSDLDEIEASFYGLGSADWTVESVLARSIGVIRSYGFRSARASGYDVPSTKDRVRKALSELGSDLERETRPTDEDFARAAEIRAWILSTTEPGEYLSNLRAIAFAEYVSARNYGFLASAPAAYERENERRVEREARVPSEFVGSVKERLTLDVTVKSIRSFDGDYGVTYLFSFEDAAGNSLKWFASKHPGVYVGDEVRLTGTVKGFETYNDVKQTLLTRCKVAGTSPETSTVGSGWICPDCKAINESGVESCSACAKETATI